jgi:hypothetical protein
MMPLSLGRGQRASRVGRTVAVLAAAVLAAGFGLGGADAAPPAAPGALAGTSWTIHYTWTGGKSSGSFTITLDTGHTLTATGHLLRWHTTTSTTYKVTAFQLVYPNSPDYPCYADYDGVVIDGDSMKGVLQTDDDTTHCLVSGIWTATKDTTPVHPATVPGARLGAGGVG